MDKKRIMEIVSHAMMDDMNLDDAMDYVWPTASIETAMKAIFRDSIDNLTMMVMDAIEEAYDVED